MLGFFAVEIVVNGEIYILLGKFFLGNHLQKLDHFPKASS